MPAGTHAHDRPAALPGIDAHAHARALLMPVLEGEGDEFFTAIAEAYEELAQLEPERIRAIDASQPAEGVRREALAAVADLL